MLIKKGIIFSCQWVAFGLGILYNPRNHLNKLVRKYTVQTVLFFGLWEDYMAKWARGWGKAGKLHDEHRGITFFVHLGSTRIYCTDQIPVNISSMLNLSKTFITILEQLTYLEKSLVTRLDKLAFLPDCLSVMPYNTLVVFFIWSSIFWQDIVETK